MFNSSEVKPHFINPRCFGEDVAAWLAGLLAGNEFSCGSAFQEDWGWSLPVRVGRRKLFLNIGLKESPADLPVWLVWVESRGLIPRIFGTTNPSSKKNLCDRLNNVLSSAPEISHVEWSAA
jgi:hypothetical protein